MPIRQTQTPSHTNYPGMLQDNGEDPEAVMLTFDKDL